MAQPVLPRRVVLLDLQGTLVENYAPGRPIDSAYRRWLVDALLAHGDHVALVTAGRSMGPRRSRGSPPSLCDAGGTVCRGASAIETTKGPGLCSEWPPMPSTELRDAVSDFGTVVASRFATGGGEPEDLLRGPFENLLERLATLCDVAAVVPTGEHRLADDRVRPDYAVHVGGALVGFAELKSPGKGADPTRYKGHDREQWERLACLPNVLYTDGQSFALYRDGDRVGPIYRAAA